MKKILKKLLIVIILLVILFIAFMLVKKDSNEFKDTVSYEGKTYVLLEYNMDIFTYHFNNSDYYEEDIVYPVSNDKWDIVYFNGDLFVLDSQVEKAISYYSDDKNYEWFITFENEGLEEKLSISINKEELKYLYNMENIKKTESIKFDDIEKFVDIVKISNDGFILSLINLVNYKDSWYWKTEIMNDDDKEYIIELSDSLNNKITNLLKEV